MQNHQQFQQIHCGIRLCVAILALLSTLLTASCGKDDTIKRNKVENGASKLEKFSTSFFYDCNLPYEELHDTDVQNSAEEYLFYIPNGLVYRTLHDSAVVLVARSDIREPSEKIGTDYSGELYQIFEDDTFNLLKYSAAGEYAIMASPSEISRWEEDEVITAFMEYAPHYLTE